MMGLLNRREFIKATTVTGVLGGLGCLERTSASNIVLSSDDCDIIIKNGTIIDGTGSRPFIADVVIKNDRIYKIAPNLPETAAQKVIDAEGLIVAPGFIDVHTHSTGGASSQNYIYQGVTTEIGGNCSKTSVPNGTSTIGHQLTSLENNANLTNFGTLVGHAPIRNLAMGLADRAPTAAELKTMKYWVAQSLDDGAFGLSSGLEYAPGIFSDADEMIELCKVVQQYDAIYTTHMRNEREKVLDSVKEALAVAKASEVRLEISHLKMSRFGSWKFADEVLLTIEDARKGCIDVACDKYPYAAWSTYLAVMFPAWSRIGDSELLGQCLNLVRRLQDPNLDSKFRRDVGIEIETMGGAQNLIVNGTSIADYAQQQNTEPYDIMKQFVIQSNGGIGVIGFSMIEENIESIFALPCSFVASDGWGHGPVGSTTTHPRSYGTFPRVLGDYVRQRNTITLSEAIKKMTSMPAEHFKIKDRGLIRKGKFADVTIFNADTVIDTADFTAGNSKPIGIEHVIVNGKVTLKNGQLTGIAGGTILRRS